MQGERRSILQHDSNLHNATISKLLGARWRQLTRDEQQPFRDRLHPFYAKWKAEFGDRAWSALERYTGTLT